MNPNPKQRRTLADIIAEKLEEKKTAMTGKSHFIRKLSVCELVILTILSTAFYLFMHKCITLFRCFLFQLVSKSYK